MATRLSEEQAQPGQTSHGAQAVAQARAGSSHRETQGPSLSLPLSLVVQLRILRGLKPSLSAGVMRWGLERAEVRNVTGPTGLVQWQEHW